MHLLGASSATLNPNISRCEILKLFKWFIFYCEGQSGSEKEFQFGSVQNKIALEEKTRTESTASGMEMGG